MPDWSATVAPGLEPVAHGELEDAGACPVEVPFGGNGLVGFEVDDHEVGRRLLHRLRTVHRIGPVLARGRADPEAPFEALEAAIAGVDWSDWIDEDTCWALRVARHGEHPFTSPEVERSIGGALDELLTERSSSRPPVELDDPDAIVRIHLGDEGGYVLWLDLVGTESLHRRGWKVYEHPAAMKPTMAAALVREVGWDPSTRLVDPTAGGATLAIEAAEMGLGASPVHRRARRLLVHRVPRWRATTPEEGPRTVDAEAPGPEPWLVLADHAPNHLAGAERNLEAAGVREHARLVEDDVAALSEHVDAAGAVVANPPYGIRSGEGDLAPTYRALVGQAARVLEPGGRIGLLTARDDLVRDAADEHAARIETDLEVHHGRLRIHLMTLVP